MGLRKSIEGAVVSFYGFFKYEYLRLVEILKYGKYGFPYKESASEECALVLANGPSLKNEIEELFQNNMIGKLPIVVVNYFALSDDFLRIKPCYYALADPNLFSDNMPERFVKMLEVLNKVVDWPLTIFVPNWSKKKLERLITNNSITISVLSVLQYQGFPRLKYRYYKNGKAVPSLVNVVIMAEYILLNMGYKRIELYGVDHTFFEGMAVNSDNIPCIVDRHFNDVEYRPLVKFGGGYFTTAEWLMDKYLTFKEHENMRGYADYLGAQIINCTKVSLIDAYVRLAQIKNDNQNN